MRARWWAWWRDKGAGAGDGWAVPALPVPHLRSVPAHLRAALHALSPRLELRWAPARREWQVLLYTPMSPRRAQGRRRRARTLAIGSAGRTRTEQALLMSQGWGLLARLPGPHLTWAAVARVRRTWMATPAMVAAAQRWQEGHTDRLAAERARTRRAHLETVSKDIYRRTIGAQVMGRPIKGGHS